MQLEIAPSLAKKHACVQQDARIWQEVSAKKDTSVANFVFWVMEMETSQDTIESYVLAV